MGNEQKGEMQLTPLVFFRVPELESVGDGQSDCLNGGKDVKLLMASS